MRHTLKALSVVLVFCLALMAASAGWAGSSDDPRNYKGEIRIASQTVNETVVLAWIAKLLIDEYTGLKTDINTSFASSAVLHQSMMSGEIDLYPSWTGTQLTGILRYEGPKMSSEETFEYVKNGFEKKFKMTWTRPLGFNNTYVMAVPRKVAEKYNLKKASDLAELAPKWTLAGDENYDTRPDAYPGWSKVYGIKFKRVLPMQYALIYPAIAKGEVDCIAAYSTDSRIKKLDLVMLEDDKGFFPDYHAAYILPLKLVEKYPKLIDVLEKISGKIDEETMAGLNLQYDEGVSPKKIASEYLKSIGLIK